MKKGLISLKKWINFFKQQNSDDFCFEDLTKFKKYVRIVEKMEFASKKQTKLDSIFSTDMSFETTEVDTLNSNYEMNENFEITEVDALDSYFEMNENVVKFNGFFILSPDYYLPHYKVKPHSPLKEKDLKSLIVTKIEIKEYLDKKPQRYNEGSLVQKLEKLGIGRPSTYNTFSKLLLHRDYVVYNNDKQKHFVPTELGKAVHT